MQLNKKGLEDRAAWEAAGYDLPKFDREKVTEATKENPFWIHSAQFFQLFCTPGNGQHSCSCLGKFYCRLLAHPRRCARHDKVLPCKIKTHITHLTLPTVQSISN